MSVYGLKPSECSEISGSDHWVDDTSGKSVYMTLRQWLYHVGEGHVAFDRRFLPFQGVQFTWPFLSD